MQEAGQRLASKTEALIKEYHRQSNIQQTIHALSQAFPGMKKREFVLWLLSKTIYVDRKIFQSEIDISSTST